MTFSPSVHAQIISIMIQNYHQQQTYHRRTTDSSNACLAIMNLSRPEQHNQLQNTEF